MKALSREEVRELDRRTIEEYGVPSLVLMENASRAVADRVQFVRGEESESRVLVVAGPGNNGGDGLAVARTLDNRGVPSEVWCFGLDRAGERSDFARQVQLAKSHGLELVPLEGESDLGRFSRRVAESCVIVDALFGTGLSRPLAGDFRSVVEVLQVARSPVVAVDLPSGLDSNTGEVLGLAVRAVETVTFVQPKRGLLRARGPEHAGRVHVAEIGIPRVLLEAFERGEASD